MRRSPARSRWLAVLVSVAIVAPPASALAQTPAIRPAPAGAYDPSATAAYTEAQGLVRGRDYSEAVARLDLAIDLEPSWPAPVELRAEAFGALAERYAPSEAYLSAQASDLERLVALEPGPEAAGRQQQAAVLRRQAKEAREVEQKRRKLVKPAMLVITASGALIASGAFMLGFIPATSSDAYGQRRYITAGATMLALGVALAVPAITLGVLAGRQGKRDSALSDFNVRTDRPQADLAVAPQTLPGGGGMALRLRF
ncbi:MAG TPA: hypothetical protein VGB85_14750 [Nannocystis sp.]